MSKHLLTPTLLLLLTLFILSCARQTTPTGGPKDTLAPVKLTSYPAHNAVNANPKVIELTFNEFISLNNPKEQIIITPDINKEYDIKFKKKTVSLTLKNPLAANTTYLINFRNAVQDITERNPADTLKLAFSTGTYIDSLVIRGRVYNSLLNKDVKDATVALYTSDTFNIFKHKPVYVTKANDKGIFKLENLKHGTYYVYAFDDLNRNLIVDSRNEAYAFDTTRLNLTSNQSNINLDYIRLDARPLKITSSRPYNTYFNIKFSKFIDSFSLREASANDSLIASLGEDKSSIKVYRSFQADSLLAKLRVTDSIGHVIDTALYIKFSPKKATQEPFQVQSANWSLAKHTGILQGQLRFNKPISSITYDSILLGIDSLTTINFQPQDMTINQRTGTLTIRKQLDRNLFLEPTPTSDRQNRPKEQIYSVMLKKASLISVESDSSTAISEQLRPFTRQQTGVISVQIETSAPSYIVQLLTRNQEVAASAQNQSKIVFEDVKPAEYTLRLIIDSNNDGRWTPGNFLRKNNTEPIIYYQNEKKNQVINLKANWELGPLLIKY